jgi:hypothetical protein
MYHTKDGSKIDVMDFLYREMSMVVIDKCVPSHAPYIQVCVNIASAPAVTNTYILRCTIPHLVQEHTSRVSSVLR